MSKQDVFELTGTVVEALPNTKLISSEFSREKR